MYLKNDLERVQKRALAIIYPCIEYSEALSRAGIRTVLNYNLKLYVIIINDDENRVHRTIACSKQTKLFS